MNTANLQLEGLLLAVASLCRTLKEKGALEGAEVSDALCAAERAAEIRCGTSGLSSANLEAIRFPIRFLKVAAEDGSQALDFSAIARRVGTGKPVC